MTVEGISRLRDGFLDARVRTTLGEFARLDTRAQLLSRTETLLGEPNNGISGALGELWDAFEDLAMGPTGPGARRQVLGRMETLTSRVRSVAACWQQPEGDATQRLQSTLADVNDLLTRVNELNATIFAQRGASGPLPNDLMDERDKHLDRLAELTAATHTADAEGRDVFATLDRLVAHLRSGDSLAVSAGIATLDLARDDLTAVGSRRNRIDAALARSEGALFAMHVELAEVEDVDIAEAIMNLQVEEVAYQATLQAMARALPPSLASFLR